ncbi:MAG TPA: lipocalin-like domain-containing protein [Bacteroidales bacterium]|nr:lipocalin-like domain-containing protein [Bacteroidales bacterium]
MVKHKYLSIRKLQIITFLFISMLLIGCNQELRKTPTDKFSGLWKLVVIEQQDSISGEWNEYRNGLQGYILYDDKDNMAVHLTSKGYQNTDIRFHDFIDTVSIEELKHRTQSYVYFAKYTVLEDENIVEHARISHSNPNLWNIKVQRLYEFKGDTLMLITLERKNSQLRVKWIKY